MLSPSYSESSATEGFTALPSAVDDLSTPLSTASPRRVPARAVASEPAGENTDLDATHPRARIVLPPELLADYKFLEKLAEGGMGSLYLMRHRSSGQTRVVKMLHRRLAGSDESRKRFLREARAALRLRHPNIVHLHEFSMDAGGDVWLVMEHLRGCDLRHALRRGVQAPISLVIDLASQALHALAFLHQEGFVHRDVSPDNLMIDLDSTGRPLLHLIDLGICKHTGSSALTLDGSFLGKLRYSAPERLCGGGTDLAGPRSDLYSLGLVLYETLTGLFPFAGDKPNELIMGHLQKAPRPFGETDPLGRIPGELRAMVLRALDKSPDRRFASAEAWGAELDELARTYPLRASDLAFARAWLAVPASQAA